MTHLVRRRKFGVTAECGVCDWRNDDGKDPAGAARRHTARTGHPTFVTIDYSYNRARSEPPQATVDEGEGG